MLAEAVREWTKDWVAQQIGLADFALSLSRGWD